MLIKKYTKKQSGFTLLEMIVSMGIFTIVAVIAVGSLVRITSLNRQAQAMQAATNNINYILESISREMRVGSHFHCIDGTTYNDNGNLAYKACNEGSKGIVFISSKTALDGSGDVCNLEIAYWFVNNNISKSQQTACGETLRQDDSLQLVDTGNVTITGITFANNQGGLNYSRFDIGLVGYAGAKEKERTYFDVRTSVSQRIAD